MNLHLVQFDIAWEAPADNARRVQALLGKADIQPDSLIVLPEMYATGFSTNRTATADAQGPAEATLLSIAREYQSYVLGGLAATNATGQLENQALLIAPDGQALARAPKLHLFSPAGETDSHVPGQEVVLATVAGLTLCPLVCYDLRFPEPFRRALNGGAEAFAVIANWPAKRAAHWRTLLIARAIENQAFVIGVNRVGSDPLAKYGGGSLLVAPDGQVLAEAGSNEQILSAVIEPAAVTDSREKFPAVRDRRRDW